MVLINIAGQLVDFDEPKVMGIINVTPDSFFADSRTQQPSDILSRAEEMVVQGAAILDVGACSTRPGSEPASAAEEQRRLDAAFEALAPLRHRHPQLIISLDTFRADIARHCVLNHGVHIINDISAGQLDPAMFETVADLHVPYILTHYPSSAPTSSSPSPSAPTSLSAVANGGSPSVSPAYLPSVARFFADRLQQLYTLGVTDVILDPGFGFGKTLEQNYAILHHLGDIIRLFPDHPVLVGISRKSMIYRLLDITPGEALNGTTVLNTMALQAGAHILRVHDVSPALEAIRIHQFTLHHS